MISEYAYGLERISQNRGGNVSVYLADGQGSIRQLTDNAGLISDTYDYYAFGDLLSSTGSTENEFRYVGEQFDPNTNFYYLRARWMSPMVGRFVSVDPSEGDKLAPISLHRYLYANSSPLNFSDPSGEMTYVSVMASITVSGILATMAYPVYKGISKVVSYRYCGPINKGGEPINDLDAACQSHDGCYTKYGFVWWNEGLLNFWYKRGCDASCCGCSDKKKGQNLCMCDQSFCSEIELIEPDSIFKKMYMSLMKRQFHCSMYN